jgi:HSP20 family protein
MASSLTHWTRFPELSELRSRFDRVLDEAASGEERTWSPRVDLVRDEDRIVLRADVPGIKPEDIEVSIEEGVLTVSGEHEESTEEKREKFIRRERRFGSFSRSLTLPQGVDPESVEAECTDGVLEVTIPAPERPESRKVEIKPKSGS